jgi:ribonuclease HI
MRLASSQSGRRSSHTNDLQLTHVAAHVGTEGNELADRMAMLAVQREEAELRLYDDTMDIATLLKKRTG